MIIHTYRQIHVPLNSWWVCRGSFLDIDLLSYGLEGKVIVFLWHVEILVATKNARPPSISYLQAHFKKEHAVVKWKSKII